MIVPSEAGQQPEPPTQQAQTVPSVRVADNADVQARALDGALWTGASFLLGFPLAFAGTVLVARLLGSNSYGSLAYYTLSIALVSTVADLGLAGSMIQWAGRAHARGDSREYNALASKYTRTHIMIQAPIVIAGSFLVFHKSGTLSAMLLTACLVVTLYLTTAATALNAAQRSASLAKFSLVGNTLTQVGCVVVALVFQSALSVMACRIIFGAVPLLLALRYASPETRRASLSPRIQIRWPAGFKAYGGLGLITGIISLLVYGRSEIFVLTYYSAPSAVIGAFALAQGVSAQLTGPLDALMGPLIPAAAGLASTGTAALEAGMRRALRISALLSGVINVTAVPALFAVFHLIYGREYDSGALLFMILAIGSTAQSAAIPLAALLSGRRAGRALLRVQSFALVVDAALAFSLVPAMGVYGAALANLGGQLTAFTLLCAAAGRNSPGGGKTVAIDLIAYWCSLPSFAAALSLLMVVRVNDAAVGETIVAVLAVILVGLGGFVTLVRLVGGCVTQADATSIGGTLSSRMLVLGRGSSRVFGLLLRSEESSASRRM